MPAALGIALLLIGAAAAAEKKPAAAAANSPGQATTPSGFSLLESLQARYAQAQSFHAKFRQVVEDRRFGKNESRGEVWLQKKGKMRWNYTTPSRKEIVADGKTLWIYDPETQQVLENDRYQASQLPVSIAFLGGEGDLHRHFTLEEEKSGERGNRILVLAPKEKREELSRLELEIAPQQMEIRRSSVSDIHGTINHLYFEDAALGAALPEQRFRFLPPPGAVRVRLDQINFRF